MLVLETELLSIEKRASRERGRVMAKNKYFHKALLVLLVTIIVGIVVVLGLRTYQDKVPELAEMETFDPFSYKTTFQLQEFKLQPCDRRWTLSSRIRYDVTGKPIQEEIYQLDMDGQSFYTFPNGNRSNVERITTGGNNVTTPFEGAKNAAVLQEEYDNQNRPIYREITQGQASTHIFYWNYRTDGEPLSGNDGVCTSVEISRLTYASEKESTLQDGHGHTLLESAAYTIRNFDQYGNETRLFFDSPCYMKTDADGYLQMIAAEIAGFIYYTRVDPSGRPLWEARYDKNGVFQEYTVWQYKDLA